MTVSFRFSSFSERFILLFCCMTSAVPRLRFFCSKNCVLLEYYRRYDEGRQRHRGKLLGMRGMKYEICLSSVWIVREWILCCVRMTRGDKNAGFV
ncbi:hypothetical protein CDAR_235311 [Caerostris darwini]|uniref:Secreted protein n=1 Tax=Caerostris darwini TaxID=1538125 RepID=A0AAV4MR08_9ARAC|nr:hypothetical protein CDAR_235311 [Caerostris darwini]